MLDLTIDQLKNGYKKKEFSPLDVTKAYLKKIEQENSSNHAYITVTTEKALAQAAISEKKIMADLEPEILEGIPLSYKDIIETKNIRTTNGSKIDKEYFPEHNAAVVKKLDQAGAVTLGKANLFEYAAGIISTNPYYGTVENPMNMNWSAGGSSSGSAAAVAAHMCAGSIGTDTAGSIRVPAACCGMVGMKPTYDLLSRKGVMPLSFSLDHVGPIARTTEDAAVMMDALTPENQDFSLHDAESLQGKKIGIPVQYLQNRLEEKVEENFYQAVQKWENMGAVIVDIDLPRMEEIMETAKTIVTSEMGHIHREKRKKFFELYGETLQESLRESEKITAQSYIMALKNREKFAWVVTNVLKTVDVIAMPTMPVYPTNADNEEIQLPKETVNAADAYIRHTCLFNITGHPALSLPYRKNGGDTATGLQLIAGYHKDQFLLNTAHTIEQHS